MRIALVSPQFPPVRGGIAEHVSGLAHALSKRHEVTVYTMLDPLPKGLPFKVVSLVDPGKDMLSLIGLGGYVKFAMAVKKGLNVADYDIVHDHSYGCFLLNKTNIITTAHSTWWGEHQGFKGQELGLTEMSMNSLYPFLSRLEKSSLSQYARIIAVSEFLKKELVDQYGLPANDITVVPNGIEKDFFDKVDTSMVRKELGLAKDDVVLFYLGRLSARKGLQLLLDAFKELSKQNPKLKLVIGGVGEYEATIKEFIKDNRLQDSLLFVGNVPDSRLKAYYSDFDIFVLPSLYETFGIVLLEAMSQGTPVVATRIGGIPEVVGDSGVIVKPDSASLAAGIKKMVDDAALRKRLGKKAREQAKRYLWSSVVKQVETVYESIL